MDSGGWGVGEGLGGLPGEDAVIRIYYMRKLYCKLKRKEDLGEEVAILSPLIAQGNECWGGGVFPMVSDQHAWLQAVCGLPGGSYIYTELPKENSISTSKMLKIPKKS